jgi:probable HAF family extracellular repeat protein
MMQVVHSRFNALLSACVLSLIATASWSQSITWLGTLPGGCCSYAYGVSNNGVVVGTANNAAGQSRAFRWTASGGMQDLGMLPGYDRIYSCAVSADGSVVVGGASNAAGQWRVFRWTESGGMQELGSGYAGRAFGVSADGSVVVGGGVINAAGGWSAFRWTAAGGMQDLGGYEAYAVSADGAVVVGSSYDSASYGRAFRWTAASGMQDLGTLPGYQRIFAYGVSADGAVVVGWAIKDNRQLGAFRWTAASGMQPLSTLFSSAAALGVSADGSVVVGEATDAAGQGRAVRWTAWVIEDLNTTYASLLTNGSLLIQARAISPNGRYIVGQGYNAATRRNEAFLLDTGTGRPPCTLSGDVNGDGRVDDADLLEVLFNFGNQCP